MESKTVRAALSDQLGRPLTKTDRFTDARIDHAANVLFRGLLMELFPKGAMDAAHSMETRRPDIVWRMADTCVLVEVKVSPAPGLLPPSDYIATVECLSAPQVYPSEAWLLVTNYVLTELMVEKLGTRGIRMLQFHLDDPVDQVRRNLRLCMIEFFGPALNGT